MARLPDFLVRWEYCKVETFVTDWSGFNGPRGITLRYSGPPIQDFETTDDALDQMGSQGWECFSIERTPPTISFGTVKLRFKRPIVTEV